MSLATCGRKCLKEVSKVGSKEKLQERKRKNIFPFSMRFVSLKNTVEISRQVSEETKNIWS